MWVVPMFLPAGRRFSTRTGMSDPSGIWKGHASRLMKLSPPELACRSM